MSGGVEGDRSIGVVRDGNAVWPVFLLYIDGFPVVNVESDAEGLCVVDYTKWVVDERFDVYLRGGCGEV